MVGDGALIVVGLRGEGEGLRRGHKGEEPHVGRAHSARGRQQDPRGILVATTEARLDEILAHMYGSVCLQENINVAGISQKWPPIG